MYAARIISDVCCLLNIRKGTQHPQISHDVMHNPLLVWVCVWCNPLLNMQNEGVLHYKKPATQFVGLIRPPWMMRLWCLTSQVSGFRNVRCISIADIELGNSHEQRMIMTFEGGWNDSGLLGGVRFGARQREVNDVKGSQTDSTSRNAIAHIFIPPFLDLSSKARI